LLVVNLVLHSRSKYLELYIHFVHNRVQQKLICLLHFSRRLQVVDILTMPCHNHFCSNFIHKPIISSRQDDNVSNKVSHNTPNISILPKT